MLQFNTEASIERRIIKTNLEGLKNDMEAKVADVQQQLDRLEQELGGHTDKMITTIYPNMFDKGASDILSVSLREKTYCLSCGVPPPLLLYLWVENTVGNANGIFMGMALLSFGSEVAVFIN